ncbi:hypothetical protein V6N13_032145 [Hibiscus sabdariffa]|uniref:Uncharacterized protein n=2 Tax=Hibiscus sabdariffa TaxID=183260 RepID=A0ABR2BDY3_9ROSI
MPPINIKEILLKCREPSAICLALKCLYYVSRKLYKSIESPQLMRYMSTVEMSLLHFEEILQERQESSAICLRSRCLHSASRKFYKNVDLRSLYV